jgi:hypothetical protein
MTQTNSTTAIVDPHETKIMKLLFLKCDLRYLVRRYQLLGGSCSLRLQGKKSQTISRITYVAEGTGTYLGTNARKGRFC